MRTTAVPTATGLGVTVWCVARPPVPAPIPSFTSSPQTRPYAPAPHSGHVSGTAPRRPTHTRAATPGEGSGVCHPCARVFIWNDSSLHQRLKPWSKSGYSREHGKSHGQTELAHEETEDEGRPTT